LTFALFAERLKFMSAPPWNCPTFHRTPSYICFYPQMMDMPWLKASVGVNPVC